MGRLSRAPAVGAVQGGDGTLLFRAGAHSKRVLNANWQIAIDKSSFSTISWEPGHMPLAIGAGASDP
jgi:hypothetical protein